VLPVVVVTFFHPRGPGFLPQAVSAVHQGGRQVSESVAALELDKANGKNTIYPLVNIQKTMENHHV